MLRSIINSMTVKGMILFIMELSLIVATFVTLYKHVYYEYAYTTFDMFIAAAALVGCLNIIQDVTEFIFQK